MWTTLAFAMMGDGDRAGELFSLLNPINHASTRAGIHRYKVEPYVVCADVYSAESHVGRGGWTWYTGSAAWMYRTAVEGILGINLRGNFLSIEPCIPRAWSGFEITYKHGSSRYHIAVDNPNGVCRGVVRATTGRPRNPDIRRAASRWSMMETTTTRASRWARSLPEYFPGRRRIRGASRYSRFDCDAEFDRNAEMAFTSNIRPIAPVGSMRSNRNAS